MRGSTIAWLAAATHIVASAAMLFLLREGLPGFSEAHRVEYFESHRLAWVGGWLAWQIAVVSLIALYSALTIRFESAVALTGLGAGIAGMAIDIATQMRYIAVLPSLRGEEFARLDRELEMMTGYAANGLYTVGFLLIAIAGWRATPVFANLLAILVALSGFALSGAAYLHVPRYEVIASAVLFPLFTLWIILIALWLRKNESS
jgi:hypothetical protein